MVPVRLAELVVPVEVEVPVPVLRVVPLLYVELEERVPVPVLRFDIEPDELLFVPVPEE